MAAQCQVARSLYRDIGCLSVLNSEIPSQTFKQKKIKEVMAAQCQVARSLYRDIGCLSVLNSEIPVFIFIY